MVHVSYNVRGAGVGGGGGGLVSVTQASQLADFGHWDSP